PHQAAAYYRELGSRRHLLSEVEQLGGKELSYNNLADLEGARRILREFTLPAAVIVKHANPCGVAMAATIEEAWERALAADPVSAYGCVAMLNREVGDDLGGLIAEHFVEVLHAPGYSQGALDVLPERTGDIDYRESMEVTGAELSEEQWGDLLFAWRVCKHASSNAIVIARDLRTIGVGAGQMSRVDAVRIAVEKAREHGHDLHGAVLASDAFFPFADGPQLALQAGVTAL